MGNEDTNKGGKLMKKVVVEEVRRSNEYSGIFNSPNTILDYFYERRKDNNQLAKVYANIGTDRDTKEEIFMQLNFSQDELLFIEEQLNVKDIEFLLPHLKVKEIVEHDRKHFPIHEAITFKCHENDSEITAHLYEEKENDAFTVRYFSTFDAEDRTLKLELDPGTEKRLKEEALELLKKSDVKEKVNI